MAYGQKINTSSISLQGEFPTIDDPISADTMNAIYRQAKNSSCYNPEKCLANSYFGVLYDYGLPPVLLFKPTPAGDMPMIARSSSPQGEYFSFIPFSVRIGMSFDGGSYFPEIGSGRDGYMNLIEEDNSGGLVQ